MKTDVLICRTIAQYPEFPYENHEHSLYKALCGIFEAWGKDPENPFKEWLEPGDTVVIKPNLENPGSTTNFIDLSKE